MKKNILKHSPVQGNNLNITPSRQNFPNWYKDAKISNSPTESEMSFKRCGPFTDSFSVGYTMPLAKDVVIKKNNGVTKISALVAPHGNGVIRETDLSVNPTLPVPSGFSTQGYAWVTKNVFEIPDGYSALLTHPLNRYDLPFLTLTAIVDGGMVLHNGSVPMFLRENFEGTIKAGTPIIQIVLFKTEDWQSEVDLSLMNAKEERNKKDKSFYKKEIRKLKRYN